MSDASIGIMSWGGCEDCIHSDKDEGGCDLEDFDFYSGLYQDGDVLYCENYQAED